MSGFLLFPLRILDKISKISKISRTRRKHLLPTALPGPIFRALVLKDLEILSVENYNFILTGLDFPSKDMDTDERQRLQAAQSPDVNDKVFRLVQIFRAQRVVLDELDVVVLRDVPLTVVPIKTPNIFLDN